MRIKAFKTLIIIFFLNLVSCEKSDLENGIYANIETNKGTIVLNLHYEETPLTVANFVSLAEGTSKKVADSLVGKRFYDGLPFHRVIPNFMIQGGDIKRNGSGDPGYKFADEFPKNEQGELLYSHDGKGVLSMANSGPNTNGSQFFITHKETPWLDGKHTVFGMVIEGLNIVDSIQQGDVIKEVQIVRVGRSAKKFDAEKAFKEALGNRLKNEIAEKVQQKKDSLTFSEKMEESKALILSSGLKFLETKKGNGIKVKEGDKVSVNYTGYFTHGAVFDTSAKKNKTFDFTVGVDRVIQGWTEGVKLIEIGGAARLFIPYDLAYGAAGYGPIPAKASLIFDVEVVKIEK